MAKRAYGQKNGKVFLDCTVMEQVTQGKQTLRGRSIQFPISATKLISAQIANGQRNDNVWWIRKLLTVVHGEPTTLEDIGLTMTAVETIHQTVLNIWSGAPTTAILPDDFDEDNNDTVAKSGE
eukprot:1511761-Rhodomonas_salina.1